MLPVSSSVRQAWKIAAKEAGAGNSPEIEPAHLLMGLCKLCEFVDEFLPSPQAVADSRLENEAQDLQKRFSKAGLNPQSFRRRLRAMMAAPADSSVPQKRSLHRSAAAHGVFNRADELAEAKRQEEVRAENLLQAILELSNPPWTRLFLDYGISDPLLLIHGGSNGDSAPAESRLNSPGQVEPRAKSRAAAPFRAPKFISKFGRDLTQLALDGKLSPVIGRREEMRNLARVLTQKRKNSAILIGDPGVGKTCVVEGLVQKLAHGGAPEPLKGKRVIEVTLPALMTDAKYKSDFDERLSEIIKEASSREDIILFIDEIHKLIGGTSSYYSGDAATFLKPALSKGEICCIGATTIEEYRKHIETDPSLERQFQLVWVNEPTRQETMEILSALRPEFEKHHALKISQEALEAAVDLSMRYLPGLRLPDKAIDLIDQACASDRVVSLTMSGKTQPPSEVARHQVAAVVAQRCRIPLDRLTEDELKRLLRMEDFLRKRVIGQDEAISEVADAIRTAKAGLKHPQRPISVFLFTGPTGTGKTELAKALAEFLFDDKQRLVRVDMSEYMELHSVSRLIGSPPGYVGYEEEGELTGPVRTNPYSIVLLDEIEKAHPNIMDIFLQVFDEGCLTDTKGRRVSFSETVIIMTSNLGSRATAVGFAPGAVNTDKQKVLDALGQALRPELINRIQRIVCFESLKAPAIRKIIDKILGGIRVQLDEKGISIELTQAAYDKLMSVGFDPQMGAREMERAIDRYVVQPLSKEMLKGNFVRGNIVRVDARNDEFILSN